MKAARLWPEDDRPVWGDHGWNVFLNDVAAIERAIGYVEANPEKEGKRRQRWRTVTPFDLQSAIRMKDLHLEPRRLGGAALRSAEEARRHRRR